MQPWGPVKTDPKTPDNSSMTHRPSDRRESHPAQDRRNGADSIEYWITYIIHWRLDATRSDIRYNKPISLTPMNQPPLLYLSLIDQRYNKIIIWHNKQFLSPKDPVTSSLHCIQVRSVQTQVMMIIHYKSCAPYTPIQTLSMELQCTQSHNIHAYSTTILMWKRTPPRADI